MNGKRCQNENSLAPPHHAVTAYNVTRRECLALNQPVPPLMENDQPYFKQGLQYGRSIQHHLGAVNGLPLDYGIDTRKHGVHKVIFRVS